MAEDKKRYVVNGKRYNVPTAEVEGFLKTNPTAMPVNSYKHNDSIYHVPVNDLDGFLQSKPDAKLVDGSKKKVSSQGSATKEDPPTAGSTPGSQSPPDGFRTSFKKGQSSTDAGKIDLFHKEPRTQEQIAKGEYGEDFNVIPESPSSSFEYILQAGGTNSLLTKGIAYLSFLDEATKYGKKNPMEYAAKKLQEFSVKNQLSLEPYEPTMVEDVAASVFGLALDSGVFAGMGGISKGALKGGSWVKNQLVKRGVAKGAADKAAKNTVRKYIARGAAETGLTLGQYQAAADMLAQLESSGSIEDFEVGQVFKEFGKGAVLGAGVGVIGASAGIINNSIMSRGIRNQLSKKAAAAGVMTGATVAEGGIFELGGALMEGRAPTVEGWLHNVAVFGAMKFAGVPSRIKEGKPNLVDYTVEELMRIEGGEKLGKSREDIVKGLSKDPKAFADVMNNPEIAWTTKSKLTYEITGALPANPPAVFGYNMKSMPDGRTVMETTDAKGNVVERGYYDTKAEAMRDAADIDAAIKEGAEISRFYEADGEGFNKVDSGLKELGYEKGAGTEMLSDALKIKRSQRTPEQQKIVDDWMELMPEVKVEEQKDRLDRPDTGKLAIEETKSGKFVVKQEGTKEAPEFKTREEADKFMDAYEVLTADLIPREQKRAQTKEKIAKGEAREYERKVTKTEKDAVQERKAEEVPVEKPTTPGKEVDKKARKQTTEKVTHVTPETSEKYADLTETPKGDYVFFHYSPEKRSVIDPQKSGSNKGAITGQAEIGAAGTVGGMSYYYTNTSKVEPGVGKHQHTVRVPKEKVYDANADPLNLAAEAKKQFKEKHPDIGFSPNHQMAWITKLAGEKGFDMVLVDWAGRTRAQSTKPMTPEAVAEYATTAEKGFKKQPPVKAEDVYADVLGEINKHQNKKGVYDELYHAETNYMNPKSEFYQNKEALTDLVKKSDLPKELKDQYNKALAAQDVPGKSVRTGKQNEAFFTEKSKEASSAVPYEPVIKIDKETPTAKAYDTYSAGGNFTGHISKMIPGFQEKQIRVAEAINETGAKSFLDIGASEGGLAKTVGSQNPNMRVVAVDPNSQMKKNFESTPEVKNVEFRQEAFQGSWTEADGTKINEFKPKEKFDIINEDFTFQFVNNDRAKQVAGVKEMLAEDGVFVTSEKFHTDNKKANEAKKAEHQKKYFTPEERTADAEGIVTGMEKDMVKDTEYFKILKDNFKHVEEFWNAGEFKGYLASNSKPTLDRFKSDVGDLTTKFSDPTSKTATKPPAPEKGAKKAPPAKKAEVKLAEDMRVLAEKIRGGKIDLKGDRVFGTVPGGAQAVNFTLEAAAKALEGGATVVEAVDAAIKTLKESEFYKKLGSNEQKDLEEYIRGRIDEASGGPKKEGVELPSGETVPGKGKKLTDKEFHREMKGAIKDFDKAVKQENADALRSYRGEVIERRIALNKGAYETNLLVDGINKATTSNERVAATLLLEKGGVPEQYKGTKVEELYNNPTPAVKETVKEARKYFDEAWKEIVENTDKMSVDQLENYVTHIWDIPKNQVESVAQWFSTRNKYLNKRNIETIKAGMDKFGIQPKTLDVGDIIKIHSAAARNAIENNKFIESAKKIDVGGFSLLSKAKDAPPGWIKYEHPALSYKTVIGNDSQGRPIKMKEYYRIPQELKPNFDALFGSQKVGDARLSELWKAYDNIGNYMKKTQLSLSLFHHGALSETAVANMGLPKAMKTILYDIGFKGTFKKGVPAFQNPEVARRAVENGVQLGAAQDFDVAKIQRQLDNLAEMSKGIPGAHELAKGLSGFNKAWDRWLWDYLHDGLKIYTFEHLAGKINQSKMTPEQYKKQLRETAQFVNDSYGGQNWDVLGVSPVQQRMMRAFLLSPDWTISTVRQALAPTGVGTLYKNNDFWKLRDKTNPHNARRKYGMAFWIKAALWYGTGINILNGVARKKDMEEHPELYTDDQLALLDKSIKDVDMTNKEEVADYLKDLSQLTMANNTLGHKTHLFDGRYEDGKERYIRWGKQFRELPELFMDESGVNFPRPMLRKMGGKAAPQVQLLSQAFTGKTASGYENYDMKDKDGWEYTIGIMKVIGKSALPFSTSSMMREDKQWRPMDIMMPSSKGMSAYKAEEYFFKGIAAQDPQYVSEVYESAVRNNLDAYELFNTAMNRHERTLEKESYDLGNDLDELIEQKDAETDVKKKNEIAERILEIKGKQMDVAAARDAHQEAMDLLYLYTKEYDKKWNLKKPGDTEGSSEGDGSGPTSQAEPDIPYMKDVKGKDVTMEVEIEETGKRKKMKMSAVEVRKDIKRRYDAINELMEAIA